MLLCLTPTFQHKPLRNSDTEPPRCEPLRHCNIQHSDVSHCDIPTFRHFRHSACCTPTTTPNTSPLLTFSLASPHRFLSLLFSRLPPFRRALPPSASSLFRFLSLPLPLSSASSLFRFLSNWPSLSLASQPFSSQQPLVLHSFLRPFSRS